MQKKYRFNKKFDKLISQIILRTCIICLYGVSLMAQPAGDLNKKILREPILKKIADLLENKFVLPEMAKNYANQFRELYEGGYYNTFADAKEFARHVNKDLPTITNDRHINFRVIEATEAGEKSTNSLHHPIRYHLLGIKENQGFEKLEWMDGDIGYLDITRFYYYPDIKKRVAVRTFSIRPVLTHSIFIFYLLYF